MNYYGNSSYSHLHQQLNQLHQQELQQNQQQHRSDYFSAAGAGSSSSLFPAPLAELAPPQHSQSHLKLQQNQTVFHCRVRDLYFSSWQGQQQHTQHHHHQQHQQHRTQQHHEQQQSVWQGHRDPRVYEGDEVHCFNSYCHMTFRFPQQLVQHIVHGECGAITMEEVDGVVRDWKSLQVELGRCGKLSGEENACLERGWDLVQGEQAKSSGGSVSQELVGYLVLVWEILSKNRSMYALF